MQGGILMPFGISAALPREARRNPAGITPSKSSPPPIWAQPACCGALRAGPRTSGAQVKLNAGVPRLKTRGLATPQAAGGAAGVGTGCCSHAPLPRQREQPGALRGLARQAAELELATGHREPPATAAWFVSHICCFLLREF